MTEMNFAAALPASQQSAKVSDLASCAGCPVLEKCPALTLPWKVKGIEMVLRFLGPQEGNMRAPCSQQPQQGEGL